MVMLALLDKVGSSRELWSREIASYAQIELIGTATTATELLAFIELKPPDAILLIFHGYTVQHLLQTIAEGPVEELNVISKLHQKSPTTHLVLVAPSIPEAFVTDVTRFTSYINNDKNPQEICEVLISHTYLQRYRDTTLLSNERAFRAVNPKEIGGKLTSREQEVLQCMVQGLDTDEIAARLFITPGKVKNHINGLFDKLATGKRSQGKLVIEAMTSGICHYNLFPKDLGKVR